MAVAQDKKASELTAPVSIADTDVFAGYRPGTGGEPNLDIRATAGQLREPILAGLADGSVVVGAILSVKEARFGAVGDGVTSDGPAILAALAAASSAGAEIYFPPGNYKLPSGWAPPTYATSIRMRGAGKGLSKITGVATQPLMYLSGGASFRASHMGFDTHQAVISLTDNSGGTAYDELDISDCLLNEIVYSAIGDVNAAGDRPINVIRFCNNTCLKSAKTSAVSAGALRVNSNMIYSAFVCNNEIRGVGGSGYAKQKIGITLGAVSVSPISSILVQGNRIYDVQNSDTDHTSGITLFGRHVRVLGNEINSVKSASASNIDNYGIYVKASYSVIANNTLVDAGGNAACIMTKGDASISAANNDNTIHDNTILITTRWALPSYIGIATYKGGMNIHDNTIEGTTVGIIDVYSGIGTKLRNMIHNNKIHGIYGLVGDNCYGIGINNPTNVIVEDNEIDGVGSGIELLAYGIRMSNTLAQASYGVHLLRNKIRNLSCADQLNARGIGITCDASGSLIDVIIDGNYINGCGRAIRATFAGTVLGIHITNNHGKSIGTSLIDYTGTCPDGRLSGNTLEGLEYITAPADNTTIALNGISYLKMVPIVARTWTNFTMGYGTQRLLVDANNLVTIANNATIKLAGGANWTPANGGKIEFVRNGTVWEEISRTAY